MSDPSDISQAKLLEAGKKAGRLLQILKSSYLNPDEMANLLTLVVVDPPLHKTWLFYLDAIKVSGARKLIEEGRSGIEEIGLSENVLHLIYDDNDHEPWMIPPVRDEFKSVVRGQFAMKMNELDPLSRLGALAFDDASHADQWGLYDGDEAWVDWARTKGNNAVLKGSVKRGKTNFALLLSEKFISKGWIVIANIKVTNPPKDFVYASTLSGILMQICRARLQGKRVLLIMDEGGLFWAKIDTVQKQNKALAKLVLTLGKLHATLLLISHFQADIPTMVVRTTKAEFEKTSLKNVYAEIREGVKMGPRVITSVPETTLQYDPDDIQWLAVDMNPDKLHDFISRLPDGSNQWEEMLHYLEQHQGENTDDLDPKDVAVFLKRKAMEKGRELSQREIADLTGLSKSTVGDVLRLTFGQASA